jgi:5-methylcytosine-specific restriction endonuclease McrA
MSAVKRGAALARRAGLKRTELRRSDRSELKRSQLKRTGPPKRRRKRRRDTHEQAEIRAFVERAASQPRCANCPSTGAWHAHHAGVYEQNLRLLGRSQWDPDNALRLCVRCHMAHHHSRSGRLALTVLREENIRYAFDVLGACAYAYLSKRYRGGDARLDRELARCQTPQPGTAPAPALSRPPAVAAHGHDHQEAPTDADP